VALSPVSFVERSAEVFGDLPAVVHGARRYTWAQCASAAARLAAALRALGVGRGSTVSVMLPNTPEMVEAHYAVPALGAVLNTLNTRLDAALLAWQMNHCEAQVLITDREFARSWPPALAHLREHGRSAAGDRRRRQRIHRPRRAPRRRTSTKPCWPRTRRWPTAKARPTSGTPSPSATPAAPPATPRAWSPTTAAPTSMRCATRHLDHAALPEVPVDTADVPLQRLVLPVDGGHAGRHPRLPAPVEAKAILDAMREHGVDHYCAAPIVHNLLINAPASCAPASRHAVRGMVAGAAPPAAMIEGMARIGFDITHVYGLTEVYGPAAVAVKRDGWAHKACRNRPA
jgi:fatty-acyl-CoA synthase